MYVFGSCFRVLAGQSFLFRFNPDWPPPPHSPQQLFLPLRLISSFLLRLVSWERVSYNAYFWQFWFGFVWHWLCVFFKNSEPVFVWVLLVIWWLVLRLVLLGTERYIYIIINVNISFLLVATSHLWLMHMYTCTYAYIHTHTCMYTLYSDVRILCFFKNSEPVLVWALLLIWWLVLGLVLGTDIICRFF